MRSTRTAWRSAAALVAAGLLGLTLVATPAQAAGSGRAMWVWTLPDPGAVTTFAAAHRVGTLYLAVPPDVNASPSLPQIKAFVLTARGAGLRVEALGGDPGWVDAPTWALDHWVTPTLATGLFDGLHLDVEPYANAGWATAQATTVRRYLSLLSTVVAAAGSGRVNADIPFWFNTIPAGRRSTLDREVLVRVAGIAVMAYRNVTDGPDGVLALAAPELRAAADAGKPARVAQETAYLGSDPGQTKQTFFGMPSAALETQLARIEAALAGNAGFAGVSVEDYQGWGALP